MAEQGKHGISWTQTTWNPVRGCSRVSEGCRFCYAERVAARFSGPGEPYDGLAKSTPSGPRWTGAVRLIPEHLDDPLRWRKPRMVFVNSMSDLFHESLTNEEIAAVFGVMAAAHWHVFQALTKRAARMPEWFRWVSSRPDALTGGSRHPREVCGEAAGRYDLRWPGVRLGASPVDREVEVGASRPWPLPNVWIGTSVENQGSADHRIWQLRRTPAAVRFISFEPALGAISNGGHCDECGSHADVAGRCACATAGRVHWWIVGGESGPGARPMHPEWARSVRDQCVAAGVPFHFKQWGEWAPEGDHRDGSYIARSGGLTTSPRYTPLINLDREGKRRDLNELTSFAKPADWATLLRVGKRKAGRLLDGKEWNEFPR